MSPIVAIALFAMAGGGGERGAAAPVIAVVSPAQPDRAMIEALNRFRGEAAAVGFGVIIVPASRGAPSAQMELVARAVPGVATVAFVRGNEPTELDVWFTDRLDGQTVVDHVSVESNRADRAVVLAVKGVDVLRARMFGLLARRGRPPAAARGESAPPTTSPSPAGAGAPSPSGDSATTGREGAATRDPVASREPSPSSSQQPIVYGDGGAARPAPAPRSSPQGTASAGPGADSASRGAPDAVSGSSESSVATAAQGVNAETRVKIATGVGAMRSIPGLGTAFLFVLRGEYDLTATSALRVTVGGLGSRPSVTAPAGRAVVQDTVVMLEWAASPWAYRRLRPVLAVGGGFHYFSAEGMAVDPFQGGTANRFVGMLGVSIGARAALGSRLALGLDAGAQILLPQVQVSVAGGNPQRGGRPATMATLILEARL